MFLLSQPRQMDATRGYQREREKKQRFAYPNSLYLVTMEHIIELEWIIDNISCWSEEEHGGYIESPGFTPLQFFLFPRGRNGREERTGVSIASLDATPPGELSFLCSDGSLIHSHMVENPYKISVVTVDGPQWEEVLALIKEKEGDRLTLRYRFEIPVDFLESRYRFKSEGNFKQQVRTAIDVIDTTLKIDPVALGCGEKIAAFILHKNTKVYIAYLNSVRNGNVTQLQLEFLYAEGVLFLKTCVSLLKIGDALEKYEEKEHVFREREQWVFFSINERELAEGGETVLLRLRFITGIIHYDPSLDTQGVSVVPNKCACIPEQKPSESPIIPSDHSVTVVKKNFMCLFQDFSDFQLKCGGVTFPVLKAVLSAHSAVFERMVSSDMREAASGSVDIEDLDAPTLARFLAFLYTRAVGEHLHADSALNLYYAAEKYDVSTLKKKCVECLCADISVENVCDILSLADKHGDDQLAKASHNFFLNHLDEVSRSEQWKSFMKKELKLAEETLTHLQLMLREK